MFLLLNTGANVSSFTSDLENSEKLSQELESLFTNELEVDEIAFSDEDIESIAEDLAVIPGPCPLCLKLMNKLVQKIPKGSSKASVKKALEKVCSIVPTDKLKTKCGDLVTRRGDQIAELVVNGVPAVLICKLITFC